MSVAMAINMPSNITFYLLNYNLYIVLTHLRGGIVLTEIRAKPWCRGAARNGR